MSRNNIANIYYTVYFILIVEIKRRVQHLLPCTRNTQMNYVVYGGIFGSNHLYCCDSTKDH